MDLYSTTLLLALAALALSAAATLSSRLSGRRSAPLRGLRGKRGARLARGAAAAALLLALLAAALHLALGHPPGSAAALGPLEFVAEHRTLSAVPPLALLLWWLAPATT